MTYASDYLVRRLRMRHLELIVALADVGSMRGAATRLNLSQPALSKMLGEIEDGFDTQLFARTAQGLVVNSAGEAAIYRARVILAELSRSKDEVDAIREGAEGLLRLGTLSVTTTIPQAIAEMRMRVPLAKVQVHEGRVREMIQRLLDGELDCVFGAVPPELLTSAQLSLLRPEILLKDELCVLCAPGHPLSRSRRLTWSDVNMQPWVAPPKDTLVRQALLTVFLNAGLNPPEPSIEVLSSITLGSMLRLDQGLLGASRLEQARDELSRGGIVRLPMNPPVQLPSLALYTRRAGVRPPPLVHALADAIRLVSRRAGKRNQSTRGQAP